MATSTTDTAATTLQTLIQVLSLLKPSLVNEDVTNRLHAGDPDTLPDKTIAPLAAQAVDILHEIEQALQPSNLVLADHFLGYQSSKCLSGAISLRIPDILSTHGALGIESLSEKAHAHPLYLSQVLRLLTNNGIFTYTPSTQTFSNNHVSALLVSDHWTQWYTWVEAYGDIWYDIARGIPASLSAESKRTAAQHNFNTDDDMFSYFEKRGWVGRLHRTLGAGAVAMAPGIVNDYPWGELDGKTVCDVGGGSGALIASLLRGHPGLRGGVFDLPAVIAHIAPFFHGEDGKFGDVGERVDKRDLVAGDFFGTIPSYEVYVMKWTLHDWHDEDAVRILENIRRAMVPGAQSRLVVLEAVLKDGRMGRLGRYGDINMMITANGIERTEEDWRRLAEEAGWVVKGIWPMRNAWVSAIDLRLS